VTGGDGFVGSHLAEALLAYGADVHVIVRPSSSEVLHNLRDVSARLRIHRADVSDATSVREVLKQVNTAASAPPVIFHLAAQSHVGESWHRPFETLSVNVVGTLNLLQSIVDLQLEILKCEVAGSSEEYGNVHPEMQGAYRFGVDGGVLLDTATPLNPQSIYATSKVAADFLTRNYHAAYGIPTVVTRMFNNYGPRQSARFVTGTIITQALTRGYVELGYLGASRDFCFVKDGAEGHIHAALFGEPGAVYVYGYGEHISIEAWCRLILRIGREDGYWTDPVVRVNQKERGRLGASEVQELRVDYNKLHALSGWRPRYSWDEGLRHTIRWYAENRASWSGAVPRA
jgi:dTDP-glucose 4,6-dehydratase